MNACPTYAGIGSRETPPRVLKEMTEIARTLAGRGWRLRSGGAEGADTAFSAGSPPRKTTLLLPWRDYNKIGGPNTRVLDNDRRESAEAVIREHHDAWDRCKQGARKLHARNAAIILGENLDAPVDAVICWTEGGQQLGGTATGMRLAAAHGRPVLNLATMTRDEVLTATERIEKTWRQQISAAPAAPPERPAPAQPTGTTRSEERGR